MGLYCQNSWFPSLFQVNIFKITVKALWVDTLVLKWTALLKAALKKSRLNSGSYKLCIYVHIPISGQLQLLLLQLSLQSNIILFLKKYANELGSNSAALSSPVFVLAHFPKQQLVIEPTNEANGPIQCQIDPFASFACKTANNTRLTLSHCLHVKPLTICNNCYCRHFSAYRGCLLTGASTIHLLSNEKGS